MFFTFTSRSFNLTDEIMHMSEKKLEQKLTRLFSDKTEANVHFSSDKQEARVEITIQFRNRILRAEESDREVLTALDKAADALERQMVKYKNRAKDRSRRDSSFKDETDTYIAALPEHDATADYIVIERTKQFALKPMDPEEAVMEMDLLRHEFYVFRNSRTDDVNVVYRRKNGTYGLIEPIV